MKISIKELLWPNVCPFCGKASAEGICPACRERTYPLVIREPKCMKCGKPVRREEQEYCYDCTRMRHAYDRGIALWVHKEPVSTSIYQFKYHNQRFYARHYALEAARYRAVIRKWSPDVIIPVPLHFRRRRKRGYNQSEVFAEEVGKLLSVPVRPDAVKRIRNTTPQKVLGGRERRKNLEEAFVAAPWVGRYYGALVVDDIYTTGNTVDAVAKILKRAGVRKVYFLTISIGQGY